MSTSTFAMHARRRGMTLPELAIVMAISGLLLSIALPAIRKSMRRYTLEEATQKFTAALVEAQTRAIKMNRAVTVSRDGLTGYKVDGGATRLLPAGLTFSSTAADSVRFVSFGPPTTGSVSFTLQWNSTTQSMVTVNAAGRITR